MSVAQLSSMRDSSLLSTFFTKCQYARVQCREFRARFAGLTERQAKAIRQWEGGPLLVRSLLSRFLIIHRSRIDRKFSAMTFAKNIRITVQIV